MQLDPRTAKKRAVMFAKKGFAGEINSRQKENTLNAVKLLASIPKAFARIERMKLTPQEKALRKALFLNNQAAKLTDARIDATMRTKEMTGADIFSLMSLTEQQRVWESTYSDMLERIKQRPFVKSDPLIANQITALKKFFSIPDRIHYMRKKHWGVVKKIVEKSITSNKDPQAGLEKEIGRLLGRIRPEEKLKVKAMDLCIAASIFADILAQRETNWPTAYQEGMEIVYAKIKTNTALVSAIAEL